VSFRQIGEIRNYSSREYYGKRVGTESFSVAGLEPHAPQLGDYNGPIMASRNVESPSVSEICAHVKHLGYSASKSVRLYGEQFEVVSDPFPEADGIAVHVTTKKDLKIRVLQIPATVLQSLKRRGRTAA
jgi:hypothetical protein